MALGKARVFNMRDILILNEVWAQGNFFPFGRHFAWLKYLTYLLVLVLAANFKQHILQPATVSSLSVSQHAD
jgi:hypothetical protein